MERAEKAKSPEMETAGLPPNDRKRFYVNGRHLLREIAGLYVLIPAGETDAPQNRITALNETGRFLWMQFQHPCTVAEAAAAAEAQYTGQPGRNAARHRKLCTGRAARRAAARGFRCGKNGRKGGIK